MFEWRPLSLEQTNQLLHDVLIGENLEIPNDSSIEGSVTDLSFYPAGRLAWLIIRSPGQKAAVDFLILMRGPQLLLLDGTSRPIRTLNQAAPISLKTEDASDYLRFFCMFVYGNEGPFQIVERLVAVSDDSLNRHPERVTLEGYVGPLIAKEQDSSAKFRFIATVYYGNTLFRAEFAVAPDGEVSVVNDEVLASNVARELFPPIPIVHSVDAYSRLLRPGPVIASLGSGTMDKGATDPTDEKRTRAGGQLRSEYDATMSDLAQLRDSSRRHRPKITIRDAIVFGGAICGSFALLLHFWPDNSFLFALATIFLPTPVLSVIFISLFKLTQKLKHYRWRGGIVLIGFLILQFGLGTYLSSLIVGYEPSGFVRATFVYMGSALLSILVVFLLVRPAFKLHRLAFRTAIALQPARFRHLKKRQIDSQVLSVNHFANLTAFPFLEITMKVVAYSFLVIPFVYLLASKAPFGTFFAVGSYVMLLPPVFILLAGHQESRNNFVRLSKLIVPFQFASAGFLAIIFPLFYLIMFYAHVEGLKIGLFIPWYAIPKYEIFLAPSETPFGVHFEALMVSAAFAIISTWVVATIIMKDWKA